MPDRYDVFISYSRQADEDVAKLLQRQLQQFAKPVFRRRALHVFRDDSSLSANPGLWSSIRDALDRSEHLLVLASPDAAASEWIGREVTHWRQTTSDNGAILLAVTDGDVTWDPATGDFDRSRSSAIPPSLEGAFPEEPRYVDLRWVDGVEPMAKDPRLTDAVADLAAPLHDRPKDELVGEDLRQHRRLVRLTRTAVALLVLLALGASVAAFVAVGQRNEASSQRDEATRQREEATRQRDDATRQREEATRQRDEAARQRDEAERQSEIAQVREFSARSLASADPFEALALGVQAELFTDRPRTEARDAFARAAQRVGELPLLPVGKPLAAHVSPGTAVDFSADGRLLATGDVDSAVRIWDAASRGLVDEFVVPQGVGTIAFSPARTQLAVGDETGSVWIWAPEQARPRRIRAGDQWISAMSWTPNGQRIAIGTLDGRIAVVDVVSGTVRRLVKRSSIRDLAWVGGRIAYIAQEMEGGTIDPRTGTIETRFDLFPHGDLHEIVIGEAGFSPDGTTVATIADNGNPYLWESVTGRRLAGPYAASYGPVEWSPDGRQFLSGQGDLHIHERALGSNDPLPSTPSHQGLVAAAAWSPDGRTIVTLNDEGTLRWWSPRIGRNPWGYEDLRSVRWVDDGVVGTGIGGGLQRWEVTGGPPSEDAGVPDGVLSPNGEMIAARELGWLALYDVVDHTFGPPVEAAPNGFVSTMAWAPNGSRLASQAGHDGTRTIRGEGDYLRIWTVGAGGQLTEVASLATEDLEVRFLAWSPDGSSLLLTDSRGLARWELDDTPPVHVLDMSSDVFEIVFDPGGSHAAIRDDSAIRLVDTTQWTESSPPVSGNAVAWSPDGSLLATADESLHVFDVATGEPIGRPVPMSEWGIVTLSWSPDGMRIAASGGLDPPVLHLVEAWTETDACALVVDVMGASGADALVGDGRTSVCTSTVRDVAPPLPVVLARYDSAGN